MKTTQLFALAGFLAAASAQLSAVPECAFTCLAAGVPSSGCSLSEIACLCSNNAFVTSTLTCVQSGCELPDQEKARTALIGLCSSNGVDLNLPPVGGEPAPAPPANTPAPAPPANTPAPAPSAPVPAPDAPSYGAPAPVPSAPAYGEEEEECDEEDEEEYKPPTKPAPVYPTGGHAQPTGKPPVYGGKPDAGKPEKPQESGKGGEQAPPVYVKPSPKPSALPEQYESGSGAGRVAVGALMGVVAVAMAL